MDRPPYFKRNSNKYTDKYRKGGSFYKPGFRNFDDSFGRKPYYSKPYKPYHKSMYKKKYQSYRSSSPSRSRSNSKLKEFWSLKSAENFEEEVGEEINNIIELKSNLKKP
jgi:hypothetical protein